jgi:hypothetical protein
MNIKLKSLVQESTSDKCFELFGNYLFGEWKNFYKKEIENNTIIEKQIWNIIRDFIRGEYSDKSKDNILIDSLKKLKQCISIYPKVLESPKTKFYRGTNIYFDYIKDYNLKEYDSEFYIIKDYIYKPKSIIQSWTNNIDIAISYGTEMNYDDSIGGVLIKKDNKDMIFNPNFLNTISFNEFESIRIGNELKCDLLVNKKHIEKFKLKDKLNIISEQSNNNFKTVYHSTFNQFNDFKTEIVYFSENKEYSKKIAILMNNNGKSSNYIETKPMITKIYKLDISNCLDLKKKELNSNIVNHLIKNIDTDKYDMIKGIDLYSNNDVYAVWNKNSFKHIKDKIENI